MYYKYQKDIEVTGEYDVIVCCGGRPDDTLSRRQGDLRTYLAERYARWRYLTTGGKAEIALFTRKENRSCRA